MYCKKCGKEIPDDSVYCNHCGARQVAEETALVKRHVSEDEVRKGILSFFSSLNWKWIWDALLLKYWLYALLIWLAALAIFEFTPFTVTEDTFDFLTNAWFGLVGVVIVAMYIRNFRRWLYKK